MTPYALIDATWPPAEIIDRGGWRLRRGAGGGKRVSAASMLDVDADIAAAEEAMRAWGQTPLFLIRDGDAALDAALASRGYAVIDPVEIYATETAALIDPAPETARIFRCSAPVALMEEIWAAGGVGPDRLAVTARAQGPKSWLCARLKDKPAGVAFVTLAGDQAMVHAIEVLAAQRRRGAGAMLVRAAARFAAEHGATRLCLAVTRDNVAANTLYRRLGMTVAARYHYRICEQAPEQP